MSSRRWSNVTKIVTVATLVLLAFVLLVTFRAMISPTIVAFLLAFILGYPVNWIQRRTGWARGIIVALIYLSFGALLALTPALLVPRTDLVASLQVTLEDLVTNLQSATAGPILAFGGYQLSLDVLLQNVGNVIQNVLMLSTSNPLTIFRGVTTGVLTVVYVLVLNFWLLKDLQKLQRLIIEQVPGDYQEEVRLLGYELGQVWHAFLRGQLVLAFVVGMMTWLALAIVGMPNAGGLALLAGFMEFLPTVGPGISGAIGTAVALFSGSTWLFSQNTTNIAFALVVLSIYVVITQIESVYLIPRLVGGRVKLHPAVTFVGIINGAIVFGVLGVLLATPVIGSVRVILVYIYRKLFDLEPFEQSSSVQPSVRIRGLIAGRKIDAIIFDLDGTLSPLDLSTEDWLAQRTALLDPLLNEERRKRGARRLMIRMESTFNFLVNQLWRLEKYQTLQRLQPFFDRMRGYPPQETMNLLPNVRETLDYLRREYRLALVTTRATESVGAFLRQTGLDAGYFDAVISRQDVRNLVPNSEALVLAAERMAVEPMNVLVVSDSDPILRSGSATGTATAGVLCGLDHADDLQSADLVLATTAELVEWL